MDDFARIPAAERRQIFSEVAIGMGVDFTIIEKDFWVCWVLKSLFSLSSTHPPMVFKGGTSLSKAYGLINRFSEDIDIVTVVDFYLAQGLADPDSAVSKSKRLEYMKALDVACARYVAEVLQRELREHFHNRLGASVDWELAVDPDDRYRHTLLFRYPSSRVGIQSIYIRDRVKIELGWRSADEPIQTCTVKPYAADRLPGLIAQPNVSCAVLGAGRTFWEKITALHAESFREEIPRFFSRHYSDVAAIFATDLGKIAARDMEMLEKVRSFKERCYPSAWARYDLAVPGNLRIVPDEKKLQALAADYRDMRMMFFLDPLLFDQIIGILRTLQDQINKQ